MTFTYGSGGGGGFSPPGGFTIAGGGGGSSSVIYRDTTSQAGHLVSMSGVTYIGYPSEFTTLVGAKLNEAALELTTPPDHMWTPSHPISRTCGLCPPRSLYVCDPARHPYFIKEWEIG